MRFFFGAGAVEFEQAGEDFVADFVGPAIAPGLLAVAAAGILLVLLVLVIEDEIAGRLQVGPAVGVEDGAVHLGVQLAELDEFRDQSLVGVVEAVVGLGQALVVPNHELGAELVIGSASCFKGRIGLPTLREREGLEAVGRSVAQVVFHRRPEEPTPIFRGAGTGVAQKEA